MPLIPHTSSRPDRLPRLARAIILCLVVAILAIPVFGQTSSQTNASPAWGKYTVRDEEFSVRMPQRPAALSNRITSRSGRQIPEHVYSTYANGAVYLVVSYDRQSLKDTFENFRLHHCTQAKITATNDNNLEGFAGKEYSLKFGEVVGTVHVYATKKRSYVVAIVQAIASAPLRDYFLSTFSLSGTNVPTGNRQEAQSLPPADSPHLATKDKQETRKVVVVSKPEPLVHRGSAKGRHYWYCRTPRRIFFVGRGGKHPRYPRVAERAHRISNRSCEAAKIYSSYKERRIHFELDGASIQL